MTAPSTCLKRCTGTATVRTMPWSGVVQTLALSSPVSALTTSS